MGCAGKCWLGVISLGLLGCGGGELSLCFTLEVQCLLYEPVRQCLVGEEDLSMWTVDSRLTVATHCLSSSGRGSCE